MKFIKYLLVLLFLVSGPPLTDLGSLRAEASAQQKKKKKRKKKKKSSSKKESSSSSKKKKRRKKKKSSDSSSESEKASKSKNESEASKPQVKKDRFNTAAYADELFNLTGELQASNKELARATRYFYDNEPKKQSVAIESKPFFTTEDFEKESKMNPDNIYVQRQLGMHYQANGNHDSAKEIYLREVSKNPYNPDAHFFLGALYADLGEYQKAKYAFEEALYLDPNHQATIDAMSMFVTTEEQKQLSRDVLSYSSKKVPDGPAQQINTIREVMASGDFTEALNKAQEASEKYPTHTGFMLLIGENHLKLGRTEDAKRSFQRAIKLSPKDLQPHVALGDLYFEQGRYVYAALSYSDAVYLDPDNSDYRYMQGLSYFNANEWGRTAASWEDLLHYRPNDPIVKTLLPQTYYVLAVEYNRIGNPTMGRQAFKNALSVNNNTTVWLPGAMGVLGKFYRGKNMYNESLIAFQEVLELIPNDASAYMGIGITYWEMGEKQLARASWEKSLELKPENNESKGWLILSSQGS